ncbi:hypothetical protein ABK040_016584 [Willaertia magna]
MRITDTFFDENDIPNKYKYSSSSEILCFLTNFEISESITSEMVSPEQIKKRSKLCFSGNLILHKDLILCPFEDDLNNKINNNTQESNDLTSSTTTTCTTTNVLEECSSLEPHDNSLETNNNNNNTTDNTTTIVSNHNLIKEIKETGNTIFVKYIEFQQWAFDYSNENWGIWLQSKKNIWYKLLYPNPEYLPIYEEFERKCNLWLKLYKCFDNYLDNNNLNWENVINFIEPQFKESDLIEYSKFIKKRMEREEELFQDICKCEFYKEFLIKSKQKRNKRKVKQFEKIKELKLTTEY